MKRSPAHGFSIELGDTVHHSVPVRGNQRNEWENISSSALEQQNINRVGRQHKL